MITELRLPRSIVFASLSLFVASAACSKNEPKSDPAPPIATVAPNASVAASAKAAAPSPSGETAGAAKPATGAQAGTWAGTYTSSKGALYVPGDEVPNAKDWKSVKWRGDEDPSGLGDGSLKLSVDEHGVVTGTVEGPLGTGVVSGVVDGKGLRANVRPESGTSFYGTIMGTKSGDALEGTMKLSSPTGSVLRAATFKLAKS